MVPIKTSNLSRSQARVLLLIQVALADAVYYAQKKYNPKLLVNIATLTGSASSALGDEYADIAGVDWLTEETDTTPRGSSGWGLDFWICL